LVGFKQKLNASTILSRHGFFGQAQVKQTPL